MAKRLIVVALIIVGIVASTRSLGAVTDTKPLTVSATVSATAKLSVGSTTVSFVNADPDTTPSITATEGAIALTVKSKTATASSTTLTVLAAADLTNAASDVIAIPNVTWTVSGAGFAAGTMNKTTAQSVGSWAGSGNRSGTQTYALANSWTYPTGAYSASSTYTLTAP